MKRVLLIIILILCMTAIGCGSKAEMINVQENIKEVIEL